MVDDWMVPQWVLEVLESVRDSGVAELSAVIRNLEDPPVERSWAQRLKRVFTGQSQDLGAILWFFYVRIDQRFRREFGTPFKLVDSRSVLSRAKEIAVMPVRKRFTHRFLAEDVEKIRDEQLDVILRFGFKIVRGDILSSARYGIWSYHHGDNNEYRGGPASFWEMYERNPLTGTILQILTEELDGGKVIYRTYGATASFDSLLVNRYPQYRKAIPFVARCLRRLHAEGESGIQPETPNAEAKPRFYRAPRNRHMLRFFLKNIYRMIKVRVADRLRIEPDHWFLGIARGTAPDGELAGKVAPLYPPRGRYWADPMLVRHPDGGSCLFFEDFDCGTQLGSISVAELDKKDRLGKVSTALKADCHLSYPFVFEWNGQHFMIPETAKADSVRLYRAVRFPDQWEYVKDVLSGIKAVDSTLIEHEHMWYLFTAVSESGGSTRDELFLFVSETPMGPWSPHPMNPIVSDVRRARPGGALFRREGILYRPGQNSARCYGHSLTVCEVTELSPEKYAEVPSFNVEPTWTSGIHGCHTLTLLDDLMVVDGKRPKWRPWPLRARL